MSKYSALIKRASNATAALALTLASLTPAVMLGGSAKAAQITARSVTMTDSKISATGVQYTVAFTTPGTPTSVVVSFCSNSPLPDDTCTAPTAMSTSSAATSTANWTVASATANTVTLDKASAAAGAQSVALTGITNSSTLGTFYARIQTWDTAGGTGNKVDFGGVAMSTTNDLTINARVQETLTFCVKADTSANISGVTDCSAGTGSQVVDLGVVGNTRAVSPVATGGTTSGNNQTGYFVLATNAISGATISYKGRSELKVTGVTCGTSTALNDQCFNNRDGSGLGADGTEGFGMSISSVTRKGTAAGMVAVTTAASAYDNTNNKWSTSLEQIASAPSPVDFDLGVLTFRAATSTPTPSGYYTTDANFIATATF